MTKALTEKQALALSKKEAKAKAMTDAIDAANAILVPPRTLSECGVVKTRCWIALHDKLCRSTKLMRPNIQTIKGLTTHLAHWPEMTADEAHNILMQLKGRK